MPAANYTNLFFLLKSLIFVFIFVVLEKSRWIYIILSLQHLSKDIYHHIICCCLFEYNRTYGHSTDHKRRSAISHNCIAKLRWRVQNEKQRRKLKHQPERTIKFATATEATTAPPPHIKKRFIWVNFHCLFDYKRRYMTVSCDFISIHCTRCKIKYTTLYTILCTQDFVIKI